MQYELPYWQQINIKDNYSGSIFFMVHCLKSLIS